MSSQVDKGEHEGDDKDDNIEGLKKENKNEDSLVKTAENVKTSWAASESKPISQVELSRAFLKSSPLG